MFAHALAVLAVVPLLAQLVSAQSCSRAYMVQPGDICDSISAAQNVSTYQLATVNDGIIDQNCDNLAPSQTICLGWTGEDCTTTHVVQLGDDCEMVAWTAGVNITILYANNPQLNADCTNLYVGEVVCTASTVIAPALPSGSTLPGTIPATATPAPTGLPWCDEM